MEDKLSEILVPVQQIIIIIIIIIIEKYNSLKLNINFKTYMI